MKTMPAQSSKDRIMEALQDLPPDATIDDAIERLVFLAETDSGVAELDAGAGIPHEEVRLPWADRGGAFRGATAYSRIPEGA